MPIDISKIKPEECAAYLTGVTREYVLKGETVRALRGIDLAVPERDFVAIMGASGSGKSTLLNLLGCLDRPTDGKIFLGADNVTELDDWHLSEIRATRIGFVFQSYNLIPQLTVLENIEVPLSYQTKNRPNQAQARERSIQLAEMVGLKDRLGHRPTQLSGGQQQRVAIARSLINDPYFILADEPTGNLDSVTTNDILDLLDRLNNEGRTIILVTHEDDVGARSRRIVRLRDGLIESDDRLRPIPDPKTGNAAQSAEGGKK